MSWWPFGKKVQANQKIYKLRADDNVTPVIARALIENEKLADRVRGIVPKVGDRSAALQVFFLTSAPKRLTEDMLAEALRFVNWKEIEKILDKDTSWDTLR
jgi:hypothetical protein